MSDISVLAATALFSLNNFECRPFKVRVKKTKEIKLSILYIRGVEVIRYYKRNDVALLNIPKGFYDSTVTDIFNNIPGVDFQTVDDTLPNFILNGAPWNGERKSITITTMA